MHNVVQPAGPTYVSLSCSQRLRMSVGPAGWTNVCTMLQYTHYSDCAEIYNVGTGILSEHCMHPYNVMDWKHPYTHTIQYSKVNYRN